MLKKLKLFISLSLIPLGSIALVPILSSCNNWSYDAIQSLDELSKPTTPYEKIRQNPRDYHNSDLGQDPYLDKTVEWNSKFSKKLKTADTSNIESWLKQFGNDNFTKITDNKNNTFYSMWAHGIDGLKDWNSQIKTHPIESQSKVKTYIDPNSTKGLFNTSKSRNTPLDDWDCMSAVQTNWIYWWLYANRNNLKTWLQNNLDDGIALDHHDIRKLQFTSTWNNTIFNDYMLKKLPDKYANHDTKLLKWFFIGDKRLQSGGYLRKLWDLKKHMIFKTTAMVVKNKKELDKAITWNILHGNVASLSFSWGAIGSHIITVYGADFNKNGEVIAIWVANSDTAMYPNWTNKHPSQIERLLYVENDNKIYLKNRLIEPNIEQIGSFGSFTWDQIWNNKKS